MVPRHSQSADAERTGGCIKVSARAQRAFARGAKDDKAIIVRNPKVALLDLEAHRLCSEVQDWIQQHDGVTVRLNFNRIDQIRLLRLRAWEIVYRVPVAEILSIIVPPIRKHSVGRMKGSSWRYGLGTSVASLTGSNARDILSTIIEHTYPNNEHLQIWRELERDRQLEAERDDHFDGAAPRTRKAPEDFGSLHEYATDYAIRARKARERDKIEGDALWRKRKAYRGNPWR